MWASQDVSKAIEIAVEIPNRCSERLFMFAGYVQGDVPMPRAKIAFSVVLQHNYRLFKHLSA